jgi:hypothetical protein
VAGPAGPTPDTSTTTRTEIKAPSAALVLTATSADVDHESELDGNDYIDVPTRAELLEHFSAILTVLHSGSASSNGRIGTKASALQFKQSQALVSERQYRVYYLTHVLMGASLWGVHPIGVLLPPNTTTASAGDGMTPDAYRVCSELCSQWTAEY